MTYKRPFRRTILQSAVRFLREARTFIVQLFLVSERNPSFGQVVRRHVHSHAVTGQNLDVVHTHVARDVGHDGVPILELDTETRIGERFQDGAVLCDRRLFRHL